MGMRRQNVAPVAPEMNLPDDARFFVSHADWGRTLLVVLRVPSCNYRNGLRLLFVANPDTHESDFTSMKKQLAQQFHDAQQVAA